MRPHILRVLSVPAAAVTLLWTRVGTMTAASPILAVSGRAAWFANGSLREHARHMPVGDRRRHALAPVPVCLPERHLVGPVPAEGQPAGFAAPPGRPQVITLAAVSGASFLYTSPNGGKTWTTSFVGNSKPLTSLAYANQTTGWVVLGWPGPGGRHELLRTTNAGRTWQQAGF
jgi:hypothetical protein